MQPNYKLPKKAGIRGEITNKTFNGKQRGYGFLKIKLSDIIPELRCSVDYFRSKVVAKRNTMN